MRIWVSIIALALMIGFTGTTVLAAKGAKADKPLKGKVVKVDGTNITVTSKTKAGEQEVTVATDKDTKFTVNGVDGKIDDVKANMVVTVTPSTGTAKTVDAVSKTGKKNK